MLRAKAQVGGGAPRSVAAPPRWLRRGVFAVAAIGIATTASCAFDWELPAPVTSMVGDAEAGPTDVAVDAIDAPGVDAGFHDFTNPVFWSTFDVSTVAGGAVGYRGAAFDGKSVYFVPFESGGVPHGVVARYRTAEPFATPGSWSKFDMATLLDGGAIGGFLGAVFDGTRLHFAPHTCVDSPLVGSQIATRHDAVADLGASWSTFDVAIPGPSSPRGFAGATTDGTYVYYAPFKNTDKATTNGYHGRARRFDTRKPFEDSASWQTFDTFGVNPNAQGFHGAVYDGKFVYFVPFRTEAELQSVVVRFDPRAGGGFTNAGSWSSFDVARAPGGAKAKGFHGGVFDGRYLYLVPHDNGAAHGLVARYDTKATFASEASWSIFDATTVHQDAKGFAGGAFDGRYVYFVPNLVGQARLVRFDTTGAFGDRAAWGSFDLLTLDSRANGFFGAAFDGRFIYLVPQVGPVVARFDARDMPASAAPSGFPSFF